MNPIRTMSNQDSLHQETAKRPYRYYSTANGHDGSDGEQPKFKLQGLKTTFGSSRTNDDVHSSIQLCPLMRCIMDTPQMQRLRGLKQLGLSEMTYVPTTHCRFEHSLGVAALAEQVLLQIVKKQPKLGVTEKDIVCVKLAGLLHDIGHGPFSHVYDGQFRKQLKRAEKEGKWLGKSFDASSFNGMAKTVDGWEHEDGSLMMIDALLEYLGLEIDEDNLDLELKQIGDGIDARCFGVYDFVLGQNNNTDDSCTYCYDGKTHLPNHLVLTSRDWIFIKECIVGGPLPPKGMSVDKAKKSDLVQELVGRPDVHKEFLYDLVSNRHSGLDVDKVDYLSRDERRAYGTAGQIDPLMIENAHVAWGKCAHPNTCFHCKHLANRKRKISSNPKKEFYHLMICYPEKMVQNAMNFFKGRFRNHQNLYTHSNTNAASYMVCDILLLADQFIKIPTRHEGDGISEKSNHERKNESTGLVSISRANTHPESYLRLKDSILDVIAISDDPNLKPARVLLNQFRAHKFYKMVASLPITSSDGEDFDVAWQREVWETDELDIASSIVKCGQLVNGSNITLEEDDIIIEKRVIHHGMKACNPVNFMRFLPKNQLSRLREQPEDLPIATQIDEKEYECCIPRAFLQRTLRVYCRKYDIDTYDFLTTCYHQFLEYTQKKYTNNNINFDHAEYGVEVSNGSFALNVLSQSPPRPFNDSAMSQSNPSEMGNGDEEPVRKRPRSSIFSRLDQELDSP